MNREYPDRPFIGVGAIIVEDGRVLLVKRAREALEETGLTVEPLELLGVFDRVVRDLDERTLYHYVLIDFLCQRVSGELCAAGDADEARWFSAEELAKLPLAKDTAEVIQSALSKAAD